MANKEMSALTAATLPLDGTELIVITQGGNSRQATVADLAAGDAASVSYDNTTSGLAGDDVQEVLDEIALALDTISGGLTDGDKGDIVLSGGATVWTIENDIVTNAKAANMATQTFKGRTTAGTGDPEDLTVTQATALLNNFVGDSGAGGTKGLVPAPAAGDAAANKFLKADGTWAVGSSVGDLDDLTDVDTTGKADGDVLTYDSASGDWVAAAPTGGGGGGGSASEWDQTVAVSDEITGLTTGDTKIVFFVARTGTLTEVFTTLSGQSSSGDVTIDVRRNGTTIFATPPSINASEDTSLTGTSAILSDTVWNKGDKIEIDIDAAGTGALGLKVVFLGTIPAIDSGEIAVFDRGSISTGTETPEPSDSAIQIATNDGAHTLAPPTETGYYVLTYTNGAAAGAITATGWDAVLDPDTVLSHTTEDSVVECAVLNDGVTSRLQVTLLVDAS